MKKKNFLSEAAEFASMGRELARELRGKPKRKNSYFEHKYHKKMMRQMRREMR